MDSARDEIERMITGELRSHHQATGPWVRAMAETDGDFDKARKRYRELRLAQLCAAREGDELQRLRNELRHEVARQQKATIYSAIGLQPDASGGEVAAAIAQILVSGTTLDAEERYAVEVLGDEGRRAEYDRHLLQQLRSGCVARHPLPSVDLRNAPRNAVPGRKSARDIWMALGIVVVGLVYLGTEHYREMRRQEIEQEQADRVAEMARAKAAVAKALSARVSDPPIMATTGIRAGE